MEGGTSKSPGHTAGTDQAAGRADRSPSRAELAQTCAVRDLLDRLADKWSLLVIELLGDGTKRFTALRREIDGISQRMLTLTLRRLERDGMVTRTVHPVVPPRVDYALTPLGDRLLVAVDPLVAWTRANREEIAAARAAYDARRPTASSA
jgi:DNA-binding HxlR family transcriptional regulator